jgi:hypothetical protein
VTGAGSSDLGAVQHITKDVPLIIRTRKFPLDCGTAVVALRCNSVVSELILLLMTVTLTVPMNDSCAMVHVKQSVGSRGQCILDCTECTWDGLYVPTRM